MPVFLLFSSVRCPIRLIMYRIVVMSVFYSEKQKIRAFEKDKEDAVRGIKGGKDRHAARKKAGNGCVFCIH